MKMGSENRTFKEIISLDDQVVSSRCKPSGFFIELIRGLIIFSLLHINMSLPNSLSKEYNEFSRSGNNVLS